MDQYIGKWLDNRYELLERIGTGGMAVVYKARCHRLNRLVAVKILKPELAGDAEFRRRFQDESRAVAMLSHPNIVAVYDVSQSDNLNYIVMELIDGITLKQYMQRRGTPLNWREALHFITQIMKALSHAHSRGIIHRDIKPHNVMVLRDGSVKVADFGIARLISAGHNTLTQEALGSVHYISPEQAKGSPVDGRSDIYSAGVVLYEMITGRLPYEGDSAVAVAIQHINAIPIPPRELNPEVPEALQEITLKAMDADANRRYASADGMLVDLEEFRKNPSIRFDYTPADLRDEESTSEPTRVVPTARVRAEEDSGRRRAVNEDSGRRRAVNEDSARRRAANEDNGRYRGGSDTRRFQNEDDYYDDEPPRRGFPVGGVLSVLVLVLFIAGMVWFLWTSFIGPLLLPSDTYNVPSLLGKTMEEIYADTSITDVWRIEQSKEYVESEEYEYGQVASQSPEAGTTVKENNLTITVYLSEGAADNVPRMPPLAGQEIRAARDMLNDLGLSLQIQEELQESDTITKDYVISTNPEMGTELTMGQLVTIYVSSGLKEQTTLVPPLTNMSLEDARNAITEAKLVLQDFRDVNHDTIPAGQVVFQSIAPYEEVPVGTGIILQVSKGPAAPAYSSPVEPWPSDPVPPWPSQSTEPWPSQSTEPLPSPSTEPWPSESLNPEPSEPANPEPSPSPVEPWPSPSEELPTEPAVEAGGDPAAA